MSQSLYHANQQREKRKKRIIITVLLALLVIGVAVIMFFIGDGQQAEHVQAVVQENTQLKLQLKEKEDRITALGEEISRLNTELDLRPTPSPTPAVPPNNTVSGGQPGASTAPTKKPSPRGNAKATPTPKAKATPKTTPKATAKATSQPKKTAAPTADTRGEE